MIRPIDLMDDDQWSLFNTCRAGDPSTVEALVSRRPELVRAEYNYTAPLHFAVREGHLPVVQFLLDHGATSNYPTHRFLDSLLTMAEDREFDELAEFFRKIVATQFPVMEGIASFLEAARRGDLRQVAGQLARDRSVARASNDTGETALHQAVIGGNLGVVNALLDAGANPDAVRVDGRRPIHCALERRQGTQLHAGMLAGTLLAPGAAYNIYLAAVLGDDDYEGDSCEGAGSGILQG